MVTGSLRSVKIFYSYSHKDKELRDELAKHLGKSHVSGWHDREILPGKDWQNEIDNYLNTADIVLLLISADFIASEYCYGIEMQAAMERQALGEAFVIPVILRYVHWEDTPFGHLQVLPTDGKPIKSWANQDEAFWD